MSPTLARLLKPLAFSLALSAIFAAGQKAARAGEVNFAGYTDGCFGAGCTPLNNSAPQTNALNTSVPQVATLTGLTFNNSTFSGTTWNGFLGIGNTGQPFSTSDVNSLGSFTLDGTAADYNGQSFTLLVAFTLPPGTAPGDPTCAALLTGSVSATDGGDLFIDFDNAPQTFTFSGGSFNFNVNDVTVEAGGAVALSGNITGATTVPEPATVLLLGTGLTGAAGAIRRRRRKL